MGPLRFLGALKNQMKNPKKVINKGLLFLKGILNGKNSKNITVDLGATHIKVKLGEWKERVDFLIVSMDAFDVILGMEFMMGQKAILAPTIKSLNHGRQPKCCVWKDVTNWGTISTLQFKKGLKKGNPSFVAILMPQKKKGTDKKEVPFQIA